LQISFTRNNSLFELVEQLKKIQLQKFNIETKQKKKEREENRKAKCFLATQRHIVGFGP